MKCKIPNRARSSSIQFSQTNTSNKIITNNINFALPQQMPKNLIIAPPKIVLRNLQAERIKRQASRSNSPARNFESSNLLISKPGLLHFEKFIEPNNYYKVRTSYDETTQRQALKIALAETKWNELKKEISSTESPRDFLNKTSKIPISLKTSFELTSKPKSILKISNESPKNLLMQNPINSYILQSKITQNFVIPFNKKTHARQLSALITSESSNKKLGNSIIQMALAVKKNLEKCQQCDKSKQNSKPKRKRVNSYFNNVQPGLSKKSQKYIGENLENSSIDENTKINSENLISKKINPSKKYQSVKNMKPMKIYKRPIIKNEENSDLSQNSDIILITENENSTDDTIKFPKETKAPRLINIGMNNKK